MPISGAGKSEGYPWAVATAVNAWWQIRPAASASCGVPARSVAVIDPSSGRSRDRSDIDRSFRYANPAPDTQGARGRLTDPENRRRPKCTTPRRLLGCQGILKPVPVTPQPGLKTTISRCGLGDRFQRNP